MADDQRKDPNDTTKSDMGQMGNQNPQSGQKGGQAQTDLGQDYSRTESGMEEDSTTSLGDEDL